MGIKPVAFLPDFAQNRAILVSFGVGKFTYFSQALSAEGPTLK